MDAVGFRREARELEEFAVLSPACGVEGVVIALELLEQAQVRALARMNTREGKSLVMLDGREGKSLVMLEGREGSPFSY